MNEEILNIQNNPPSQEEIDRAVNRITRSLYSKLEHGSEKADLLNNYYVHFNNPDSFAADIDRYKKATPHSVSEAAKIYLDLHSFAEMKVVPENGGERRSK